MRHDFNKGKFFNIFKKNRIIKEIVDHCCNEKVVNKGLFILRLQQVVYKHHQNFSLKYLFLSDTLSENKLEPR